MYIIYHILFCQIFPSTSLSRTREKKNPPEGGWIFLYFRNRKLSIFNIGDVSIKYELVAFFICLCDIVSFSSFFSRDEKWNKLTMHLSEPNTDSDFFREEISFQYLPILIGIELYEIIESSHILPYFTDDIFSSDRANLREFFIECSSEYYLHTAISRACESRESRDFTPGASKDLSNTVSSYHSIAHRSADSRAGLSSMMIFFFGMWRVALVMTALYPSQRKSKSCHPRRRKRSSVPVISSERSDEKSCLVAGLLRASRVTQRKQGNQIFPTSLPPLRTH